jgi:prepilin-type N-terminal cleavage/methylation domain-containing protein
MARSIVIRSRACGFTLIEVIVAMVIAGVLATIGATVMSSGFRTYFLGRELAQDAAQGTLAVERMTRDLRRMRSATAADLPTMTATTISFVDVNGNTNTYDFPGGGLVTYSRNGGAAQPLAANVSNLTFTYLQNDGQQLAGGPTTVAYVVVAITVTSQNSNATFRGTVKPANF